MVFRVSCIISDPELLSGLNFVNLSLGFVTGYMAINIMLDIARKAKVEILCLSCVFALAVLIFFFKK